MFKYSFGKKLTLLIAILIFFTFLINQAFASNEPKRWELCAAPAGGSYFALGAGFSQVLAEKLNIKAQVKVTNGGAHNTILVGSGDAELGFATSSDLLSGWNGTDWAEKEYKDLRLIAPLNFITFQAFSIKGKGIKSIYDLEGKTVTAGEAGSSHDIHGRTVLRTLGITPARIVNLPKLDSIGLLRDGLADASIMVTAVPNSGIIELGASHDIVIFALSDEDIEKVMNAEKHFMPSIIPKGTYENVKDDLKTIDVANNVITHKGLSSEIIYEVTKAWFDNIETLVIAHPSAKASVPGAIVYGVIPLHTGAFKYYSELGLDVDHLAPPELK